MLCKRCGLCCLHRSGPSTWELAPISDHDKARLRTTRLQHRDPCEMLTTSHGTAICLVQELYGYDKKPQPCKDTNCPLTIRPVPVPVPPL